jgi:hypothetical protein
MRAKNYFFVAVYLFIVFTFTHMYIHCLGHLPSPPLCYCFGGTRVWTQGLEQSKKQAVIVWMWNAPHPQVSCVESLVLTWWHYFERWWRVRRWGLIRGRRTLGCALERYALSLSLSASWLPQGQHFCSNTSFPSWCSASPEAPKQGSQLVMNCDLRNWAKINISSFKLCVSSTSVATKSLTHKLIKAERPWNQRDNELPECWTIKLILNRQRKTPI